MIYLMINKNMKDYIEYIVKSNDAYRRTIFFLTLVFLVIIFILVSITVRKKSLHQIAGVVQSIERTQVQRKNNTTFEIEQQYHLEDVISIRINNRPYYVESNFASKWEKVLDNVQVGNNVLINFIRTEEGNSICQLEKNSLIILNYNELSRTEYYVKFGLLVTSVLVLSYIIFLVRKRRKYLQSNNGKF